ARAPPLRRRRRPARPHRGARMAMGSPTTHPRRRLCARRTPPRPARPRDRGSTRSHGRGGHGLPRTAREESRMRDTAHPKIKQYTDKRTSRPRYLVRYRKPDGSQTMKRGFTTKRDAETWLHDVEGAKLRGEFVAVSAGRVPLRQIAEPWLAAKRPTVKASTFEGIESAWTTHIEETFGDVPLHRIRTSDVETWVTGLAENRSASVVRRSHAALAQMLDTAVRDRRLAVNPAR